MKIFGYVLIFMACSSSGVFLSRHYQSKLINSNAYIAMLSQITEEISLWHLPLNDIYNNINFYELNKLGFISDLKSNGLTSAYQEHINKFLFDNEHLIFCQKLGTMPLSDTVKLCEYEIKRLSKILEIQTENIEKKIKLSPALALLLGAATIILIL